MQENENLAAENSGGQSVKQTKQKESKLSTFRWSGLSYTTRVTLSFALIAAMTALVAIGVVSFVWEQHFQTYASENIQSIADVTAENVGVNYKEEGNRFTSRTLAPAENAIGFTSGLGVQVVDAAGAVVYDSSSYVAKDDAEDGAGFEVPSLAPKPDSPNVAHAPIISDGVEVGAVRVWVYGSDSLLRSSDREFRDNSYRAMVTAGLVAIVLASLIGYLFARNLVRPVRRIAQTAEAITEGDLSARTNLSGRDEVALLGQTFDEMADKIESDRELERRLTTDVAHELRTPLMAIQATVEAMVDGVFPSDQEHLATVSSEVQRLSRLVDSLLKLSRLENRSNPMKEEVVDVGELITGVVITHETFVEDAGLTIDYRADFDTYVLGDPDMIRQATANLISNAVRYTPEGGHISVRVGKGDAMASIAVQDTGIGLSPDEAKMVFSRFWRADAGRNRSSGGLGIGLSVVKEIVDRHEGWVEVEGRKGEGACFTIYIPLYDRKAGRQMNPSKVKALRKQAREDLN